MKFARNVCAFLISTSACFAQGAPSYQTGPNNALTDVKGVRVGHYTRTQGTLRGTTAILFDGAAICGLDVRGGNPVTLGDSTFNPVNIGDECDAITLSGGSAFGLAAEAGVVDYLFEHHLGVATQFGPVPIVPAAVIFDLRMGDGTIHPTRDWGYEAAKNAKSGPVEQGNVGAGAGGTIGKMRGATPMKGGLGTASTVLPDGITVAALVVMNSLGEAVNPATGQLYATGGGFDHPLPLAIAASENGGMNTTLVVIATDAPLTKPQLTKIAQLGHDGLARSIRPIHTMLDGDTVYAVSVAPWTKPPSKAEPWRMTDEVGSAAADVIVQAIMNGLRAAKSVEGFPSYTDWQKSHAK